MYFKFKYDDSFREKLSQYKHQWSEIWMPEEQEVAEPFYIKIEEESLPFFWDHFEPDGFELVQDENELPGSAISISNGKRGKYILLKKKE